MPVGWGDINIVELVFQMEDFGNIVGLILAETLLSLDRASRVDIPWSVHPILLQVSLLFPYELHELYFKALFKLAFPFLDLVEGPPEGSCYA